jgi:hypothetical protein
MPDPEPRLVAWTDHALVKAELLGVPRTDIEEAVVAGHGARERNTGVADWIVTTRAFTIAYNFPADELTALVVTLWRRG